MILISLLDLATAVLAGPPPPTVEPPVCSSRDPSAESRLALAAAADQGDRKSTPAEGRATRDASRLMTVHELLDAGHICTAEAALDAAIVLQHSRATADHLLGFRLSTWAASQGLERGKKWAALAWDRALVSGGERQWFGSQAVTYDFVGPPVPGTAAGHLWCLVEVDAQATDSDRASAGMSPLKERITWIYGKNDLPVPEAVDLDRARVDGLVCAPKAWTP